MAIKKTLKENPTKTTYPQRNFCKNRNSKHVSNIVDDEDDTSDLKDEEYSSTKNQQGTILNDSDMVHINKDQFNYDSNYDDFY
eukprot:5432816-Ditylum_brightwellii.AAC.1